jgi:hypothetical protein
MKQGMCNASEYLYVGECLSLVIYDEAPALVGFFLALSTSIRPA